MDYKSWNSAEFLMCNPYLDCLAMHDDRIQQGQIIKLYRVKMALYDDFFFLARKVSEQMFIGLNTVQ